MILKIQKVKNQLQKSLKEPPPQKKKQKKKQDMVIWQLLE